MADYWTAFAAEGKPASVGRPAWESYAAKTDRHLVFDDPIRMADHVHRAACDALESHLRRELGL
jgi:carboxylesterase type B